MIGKVVPMTAPLKTAMLGLYVFSLHVFSFNKRSQVIVIAFLNIVNPCKGVLTLFRHCKFQSLKFEC